MTNRLGAAMWILVAACATDPTTTSDQTPSTRNDPWTDGALPVLVQACGACHGSGAPGDGLYDGLAFLDGSTPDEIRETVLASGIVDLEEPTRSRLLTKGIHQGPYLSNSDIHAILAWLEFELGN